MEYYVTIIDYTNQNEMCGTKEEKIFSDISEAEKFYDKVNEDYLKCSLEPGYYFVCLLSDDLNGVIKSKKIEEEENE